MWFKFNIGAEVIRIKWILDDSIMNHIYNIGTLINIGAAKSYKNHGPVAFYKCDCSQS